MIDSFVVSSRPTLICMVGSTGIWMKRPPWSLPQGPQFSPGCKTQPYIRNKYNIEKSYVLPSKMASQQKEELFSSVSDLSHREILSLSLDEKNLSLTCRNGALVRKYRQTFKHFACTAVSRIFTDNFAALWTVWAHTCEHPLSHGCSPLGGQL